MALTAEQRTKYEALFRKYPVAISHIHQQFKGKRLGLVLGAGIGKELGFPSWKELVQKIALNNKVNGGSLFDNPVNRTVTSQMLFQLFKDKYLETDAGRSTYSRYGDIELRKKWKELVHDILYTDVSENIEVWESACPYLRELINVIKDCGTMTVTYNFDDTIEQLLHKYNSTHERRGFTVIWDTNVQTEKRQNIVYHPNGYLPRKLSDFASRQLVFLEDTFEDQLVDSFNGHYNALNNHYSSKTCLLLGISLEDHTLKHMLRMNAKKCYGHIHYIIQHMQDHNKDSDSVKMLCDIETKANFDTYNLYTLHLTSAEIATLMELTQLPYGDFKQVCADMIKTRKFFIMGAVAVGKSTTVSQFKCFQTFDEWLEDMPDNMEKAPSTLSDDNEKLIDNWIAEQISRKNDNLVRVTTDDLPCIAIIDRTPIDAYAFFNNALVSPPAKTPQQEKDALKERLNKLWCEKAKLHKSKQPVDSPLTGGKIIFLHGDITEMVRRAKQKFRVYEDEDLEIQQSELLHIAMGAKKISSEYAVAVIDVTNKTIEQVAKEVAEDIYFNEYAEVKFQNILTLIESKGREFYEK